MKGITASELDTGLVRLVPTDFVQTRYPPTAINSTNPAASIALRIDHD